VKNHFELLSDPRQQWKVDHNLSEIVIMTVISIISGFEIWEDIADYCQKQTDWFKEKVGLVLENGVASHDTFRRVFSLLKPRELESSFRSFVWETSKISNGEIVGIDGKTLRGSGDEKSKAIHMVSAWAAANKVVLGQIKTDEKSNEITAIPTLIGLLDLKGCIVTIDAMGCQKDIVDAITDAEADYVIGLKGNQRNLHKGVRKCFENTTIAPDTFTTNNKGHGREELRKYELITDIDELSNLPKIEDWKNLNGIGRVCSTVLEKGKLREETRYFIASLTNVETFAKAVRGHWGIENSLHWCLDVNFNEDDCRITDNVSAENLAVVRHMAVNALNKHPAKISMARKRRKCQYDYDFLVEVVSYAIS
jgi:predicted transposase YbfD/YdcC